MQLFSWYALRVALITICLFAFCNGASAYTATQDYIAYGTGSGESNTTACQRITTKTYFQDESLVVSCMAGVYSKNGFYDFTVYYPWSYAQAEVPEVDYSAKYGPNNWHGWMYVTWQYGCLNGGILDDNYPGWCLVPFANANCSGYVQNSQKGSCVSPPQRSMGKPRKCQCAGDPINPSSGNTYKDVTDFRGGGPFPWFLHVPITAHSLMTQMAAVRITQP